MKHFVNSEFANDVTTSRKTTATKTLEATLAPPTTGKEQRLQRTVAMYRRALSEAFESGADTQSAVNDVVTGYDLTSYAKDALKNYVPNLRRTHNAREIQDDHPVRFTNRGWSFDHSKEREHECSTSRSWERLLDSASYQS